jgi:hypothetical protein
VTPRDESNACTAVAGFYPKGPTASRPTSLSTACACTPNVGRFSGEPQRPLHCQSISAARWKRLFA